MSLNVYIGVVWGVNLGIYGSPMECLGPWVRQGSPGARAARNASPRHRVFRTPLVLQMKDGAIWVSKSGS